MSNCSILKFAQVFVLLSLYYSCSRLSARQQWIEKNHLSNINVKSSIPSLKSLQSISAREHVLHDSAHFQYQYSKTFLIDLVLAMHSNHVRKSPEPEGSVTSCQPHQADDNSLWATVLPDQTAGDSTMSWNACKDLGFGLCGMKTLKLLQDFKLHFVRQHCTDQITI